MTAFQQGRLRMRGSLHLGVGLLAATSGSDEPGRLAFETAAHAGRAGSRCCRPASGRRPVLCLHGLGGTKASFLPTVAALADRYRVVAVDLPGLRRLRQADRAPYDAEWFARSAFDMLDALGIGAAHVVGNSMGGRVAIEAGLMHRDRVRGWCC